MVCDGDNKMKKQNLLYGTGLLLDTLESSGFKNKKCAICILATFIPAEARRHSPLLYPNINLRDIDIDSLMFKI
jgi:hypothetical protein